MCPNTWKNCTGEKPCEQNTWLSQFSSMSQKHTYWREILRRNVGKPVDIWILYRYTEEFILERSSMNVRNVKNPIDLSKFPNMSMLPPWGETICCEKCSKVFRYLHYFWKHEITHTGKKLCRCKNVISISYPVSFRNMKEITLERTHMYVKSVVKHLLVSDIFKHMKELVLERTL